MSTDTPRTPFASALARGEVVPFPGSRPPATPDQVAVTHRGETRIYDCPQDLQAAVLTACSPELEAAELLFARQHLRRFKARVRGRRLARVEGWRRLGRTFVGLSAIAALAGFAGVMLAYAAGLATHGPL